MNNIHYALRRYFNILEGTSSPNYISCKNIPVNFSKKEPLELLWKKHETARKEHPTAGHSYVTSLLDLKVEIAQRLFSQCCYCEHRCNINRKQYSGKCKIKESFITSEFLHLGEESVLIPSHTIFFSGCTFTCVFCQNWDISQKHCGWSIHPDQIVNIIQEKKEHGSRNVNWVGGEPTPNLLFILHVLQNLNEKLPQVWNSNMYCSQETMSLLNSIIDIYLTDFKFGNNECAKRLSGVDNYLNIIKRNHLIAFSQGELIIRHLILPNHIDCCSKPILTWIHKKLPRAIVNIMDQYRPEYRAKDFNEINRPLKNSEYEEVLKFAQYLDITII